MKRSVLARVVVILLLLAAFGSPLRAQNAGAMPDMPGMSHDTDMSHSVTPGPRWTDKEWSVFNHRAIGWFLFLWGATALVAGLLRPRETWFRFVPPMMLFGAAEFLFVHGDPEAWPIGPVGFWTGLRDPEVLQHRIFLLLIVAMGALELLRAAGRLPTFLRKYSLPLLAIFGATLLFFHKHGGAAMAQMKMDDPGSEMGKSMALVQHEHFWFSVTGFGFAAAKLSADTDRLRGRFGTTLWTIFAMALGLYMTRYTE